MQTMFSFVKNVHFDHEFSYQPSYWTEKFNETKYGLQEEFIIHKNDSFIYRVSNLAGDFDKVDKRANDNNNLV